jgi:hypothetical protein
MNRKPLNKNIRIRLNEDENQALTALVIACGEKNMSNIIRKLIREGIGQGPDLLTKDLGTFREAIRQLGALGCNINQIARALNSGMHPDPGLQSVLEDVKKQVLAVQKEVLLIAMRSRNRWVLHG